MPAFSAYLQAKYALDARSFNRAVWRQLCRSIRHKTTLDILDVGSGCGAMLRRISLASQASVLSLTGLDVDSRLLKIAAADLSSQLQKQGFRQHQGKTLFTCGNPQRQILLATAAANAADFIPPKQYDLITAHAVMDLLPLTEICRRFHAWLKPGGLFYSSINYDGLTSLFPAYEAAEFEQQLLTQYDASMESRHKQNKTGGALTGRRLLNTLIQTGFKLQVYGSSDWNITPLQGRYRDQDALLLKQLLDWMRSEGEQAENINANALQQWYQTRMQQIETGELGMIVHQLDLLGIKDA